MTALVREDSIDRCNYFLHFKNLISDIFSYICSLIIIKEKIYEIIFNSQKYAIVHQYFLMTISRKIIVRKPTLQTTMFFYNIHRINTAKSRPSTPKRQRCLFSAISSSMPLLFMKSVTWFLQDSCGLPLLLLPCGVHW